MLLLLLLLDILLPSQFGRLERKRIGTNGHVHRSRCPLDCLRKLLMILYPEANGGSITTMTRKVDDRLERLTKVTSRLDDGW